MAGTVLPLSEQTLSALEAYDFPAARSGKPRLDSTKRLLHRFYEPLVLLSILEPTRGDREPHFASGFDTVESYHLWHKFLDQISWLCDYESGGKTVSAIAVQATPQGPTYWLSTNSDPTTKALPHLEWVLRRLANLRELSSDQLGIVEDEIVRSSITHSSDKVKTYSRWLFKSIKCVMEHLPDQTSQCNPSENLNDLGLHVIAHQCRIIGLPLLEDLRYLERLRYSHVDLCNFAWRFRSLPKLDELCGKRLTTIGRSDWSNIRHCIGRLGSWSKASKIIVHVAKRYPNLVENFRIECLVTPAPMIPPAADHRTSLEGAIRRMLPKQESVRLKHTQEVLRRSRVFDFETAFLEKYTSKNFAPRPHAEVVLLEHFYLNNLAFMCNERYIGCSKPSCYCCDLYIKFHPGKFIPRPCHGNIWANWCAPALAVQDDGKIQWHVKRILNHMIDNVRQDALTQIMSKLPRRPRLPDSTTGLSPIPALSALSVGLHALSLNSPVNHDEVEETWEEPCEEECDSGSDGLYSASEISVGTATEAGPAISAASTAVVRGADGRELVNRGLPASKREPSRIGEPRRRKWSGPTRSDDEDVVLFKGRKRQCR